MTAHVRYYTSNDSSCKILYIKWQLIKWQLM